MPDKQCSGREQACPTGGKFRDRRFYGIPEVSRGRRCKGVDRLHGAWKMDLQEALCKKLEINMDIASIKSDQKIVPNIFHLGKK